MKVNILKLNDPDYPDSLTHLHKPPKCLYFVGSGPENWLEKPKVAIVGSRKITPYGKEVTRRFASELAKYGVVIISGLAFGVDAVAHQATVDASGIAVAVLPTPVEEIHPVSNQQLARKIIEQGGTLISEYRVGSIVQKSNFIERNRIVSGLADILLITEAAINSGSLHTARFALEQGKTVMAVPGNITSPASEGCNNLIKSGAIPVTQVEDILFALSLKPETKQPEIFFRGSEKEQKILELLKEGVKSQEELALKSRYDGATISSTLTALEINGVIRPLGSGMWTLF